MAILLLSGWSLTALVMASLNVLNENKGFLAPVASIALLTFLVCRLIVVFNPLPTVQNFGAGTIPAAPNGGTVAHLIASADYGSRSGAFVLFLLTCTWLYQLLQTLFLLIVATLISASLLITILYGEKSSGDDPAADSGPGTNFDQYSNTTAIVEFQEQTGVDPNEFLRRVGPRAFILIMGTIWVNFLTLCLYVLGHAAKSFSTVLSTPTQTLVIQQTEVTVTEEVAVPTNTSLLGISGPAGKVEEKVSQEKIIVDA